MDLEGTLEGLFSQGLLRIKLTGSTSGLLWVNEGPGGSPGIEVPGYPKDGPKMYNIPA